MKTIAFQTVFSLRLQSLFLQVVLPIKDTIFYFFILFFYWIFSHDNE